MGVMTREIQKPWNTTGIRENVMDLEGPTGTDLKVMLLTKTHHL